jgi:hypothetical protein
VGIIHFSDLILHFNIAAIVNNILPEVNKTIPIIVIPINSSIMFIDINLVVENKSNALYAKIPDTMLVVIYFRQDNSWHN